MPVATVDGLEVYYETRGSGAPLLMMAPGGFDASIDKWLTTTAWKGLNALDRLSRELNVIAYDRREAGRSGGEWRSSVGSSTPSRRRACSTI